MPVNVYLENIDERMCSFSSKFNVAQEQSLALKWITTVAARPDVKLQNDLQKYNNGGLMPLADSVQNMEWHVEAVWDNKDPSVSKATPRSHFSFQSSS